MEAQKYLNRLRDVGKDDVVKLLERFMSDSYIGKPRFSREDDVDEEEPSDRVSVFSIVLFFIAAAVFSVWLIVFDGWRFLDAIKIQSK